MGQHKERPKRDIPEPASAKAALRTESRPETAFGNLQAQFTEGTAVWKAAVERDARASRRQH